MTLLSSHTFSIMRPRRGRKPLFRNQEPKTRQTLKHSSNTGGAEKLSNKLGKKEFRDNVPSRQTIVRASNKDPQREGTQDEEDLLSTARENKSDSVLIARPNEKETNGDKKHQESEIIEAELDSILRKQREVFNSKPVPVTKGKRGRPRKIVQLNEDETKIDSEPAAKRLKKDRSNSPSKNDAEKTNNENNEQKSSEGNEKEEKDKSTKKDKKSKEMSSSYIMYVTKDDTKEIKTKVFRCRICSKEATAKADLIKHIRVHTGERPYKCKICNASFIQVTALRGHETIHSGEKPFTCDLCGKKFAIKDRLRLHMRVHTGEKPHQCSLCDLSFARRSQVSQHMRIHDSVKDKFKCDECLSSFASYHTLKAHKNGHLGIKEFQCFVCGKKFLRVEGMHKHVRTVHGGNRPYTCNICGKAFKGHLQQHMRLHKGVRPYTCHLCDAAFTQNSQLTVHLRIHTGERPYKCQVCGSSFAHSSACKIHMRSHTGEKPFKCVLCNHAFSQLPHLKKHMKCVHGADKPYMCMICKEFFKTQADIDAHRQFAHNICKSAEEEAQETIEEATLARLRNRLAVLLYRISSEDRRTKFGFGSQLIDEVLKLSLKSSGHVPVSDSSLTPLEELRQNVLQLLQWTIPQETMEEYHRNNMTVDEVLDMLTS